MSRFQSSRVWVLCPPRDLEALSVSPFLMPEVALFSIYKSCWGEPGEQTLHTPPGRVLAHKSICMGAMPAFLLTTNPSSAFPGEQLRSFSEPLG